MPSPTYYFLAMIGFGSLGYFIIRILFYFQMPKRNGKDLSDTSACLITFLMIIIGICTLPVTAVWGLFDYFTMNKARDIFERSIRKENMEYLESRKKSIAALYEDKLNTEYDRGYDDGYWRGYADGCGEKSATNIENDKRRE